MTPLPATQPTDDQPMAGDDEPLQPLTDRDRDLFLEMLDHPPEPTDVFRKAAAEYRKRRG